MKNIIKNTVAFIRGDSKPEKEFEVQQQKIEDFIIPSSLLYKCRQCGAQFPLTKKLFEPQVWSWESTKHVKTGARGMLREIDSSTERNQHWRTMLHTCNQDSGIYGMADLIGCIDTNTYNHDIEYEATEPEEPEDEQEDEQDKEE